MDRKILPMNGQSPEGPAAPVIVPAGYEKPGDFDAAPVSPPSVAAHGALQPPEHVEARSRRSAGAGVRFRLASPAALRRTGPVALILCLPSAVIAAREPIVRIAPPASKMFAAIGMPVNFRGLELRNVTARSGKESGVSRLIVEGRIVNIRRNTTRVPALRVVLRDDQQNVVYSWRASSPKSSVRPGEAVRFRTHLATPPGNAASVLVRFAGD